MMPMWWTDYFNDTLHLSDEEHGVYLKPIGRYWLNRGPLPADIKKLSQMTGTHPRVLRRLLPELEDPESGRSATLTQLKCNSNPTITQLFAILDGKLHPKRID